MCYLLVGSAAKFWLFNIPLIRKILGAIPKCCLNRCVKFAASEIPQRYRTSLIRRVGSLSNVRARASLRSCLYARIVIPSSFLKRSSSRDLLKPTMAAACNTLKEGCALSARITFCTREQSGQIVACIPILPFFALESFLKAKFLFHPVHSSRSVTNHKIRFRSETD